jgi:hypothetical protein
MRATRRDVEAAQRRTGEAEAATTAARKELAEWRAKAYALQTKVGPGAIASGAPGEHQQWDNPESELKCHDRLTKPNGVQARLVSACSWTRPSWS